MHNDVVYYEYYEEVYILLYIGLRSSEFCGLTLKDIDLEHNQDHQLQRAAEG